MMLDPRLTPADAHPGGTTHEEEFRMLWRLGTPEELLRIKIRYWSVRARSQYSVVRESAKARLAIHLSELRSLRVDMALAPDTRRLTQENTGIEV